MNSQTLRATRPLNKFVVAGSLALILGAGLAATGAARTAVRAAQSWVVSAGVTQRYVDPNPWCLGSTVLPTLHVSGQGVFQADTSSASYGNWVSKSGTFNNVRYNRVRTKTVVDVVYPDEFKLVRIGPGSGGLPAVFFHGTAPYSYSEPFTPDPGTGAMTGMVNIYAQESRITTTTEYPEYWYKSGNNLTYVGTGPGTVVSQVGPSGYGMGLPANFYYEVVNCPR